MNAITQLHPLSDLERFEAMSLEDKQVHIASWFDGMSSFIEEIDYTFQKPSLSGKKIDYTIQEPKKIRDITVQYGDTILFWYYGENYSCPLDSRNKKMNFFVDDSSEIHTIKI